jgi:hypothetical protein
MKFYKFKVEIKYSSIKIKQFKTLVSDIKNG